MKQVTATIEGDVTFTQLEDSGLLEVTDFQNGVNLSGSDLRFSFDGFTTSEGQKWRHNQMVVADKKRTITIKTRMNRAKVLVRNGD